jgi:cell division FtsZ-interacting protein ZapD
MPIMLQQLLSVTQTAERLRVRPEYVRELVKKQRLTFIHGEQLDAVQVEKLAKLMDKLRNNGIATLVQIVDEKGDL